MIKKYLAILILLIFSLLPTFAQNTIGTLVNTAEAYNGYTLFTVDKSTYLINNCGQVINEWISENNSGKSVYILPDGSLLRAEHIENEDVPIPGIGGKVTIRDWNNNLTWQYDFSDLKITQHHDVFPLPNGNILILIAERKTLNEATLAGRDPSILVEDQLYNEKILEIQPVGTNDIKIIWEWNFWDHLIQDFDNTKNNFGDVLNNPQLLDVNYLGLSVGKANWLHVNSIQYNSDLDQIIISARQLNEFYIIDHSTTTAEASLHTGGLRGKGGDFLYRWGNPISYRAGEPEDQKFFGQHFPHWIPDEFNDGGKIIIFNNGFKRSANYSSVDILSPTQTIDGNYTIPIGKKIGPEDFDWTYIDPIDPNSFYSKILSSAQRLANGNTLICEGTKGHFFEIDDNDNTVWEYISPLGNNGPLSQGEAPAVKSVFRAYKYSVDYEAFNGKNLSPDNPIELDFNLDNCEILATDELSISRYNVYPNPTTGKLNFQNKGVIDRIEIFNIFGKQIGSYDNQNQIDLNNMQSGVYFLKIYSNIGIESKKIILAK